MFVVLPSIRLTNFPTVIERAQVYILKTKPNIQPQKEIRSKNQVLALKEDRWRLSVRRSTINPAANFDTVIERAHVLHT